MSQPIRRNSSEPVQGRIIYASATVPTSWTTIYTVPDRQFARVSYSSYYATDANAYTLKVSILDPSGNRYIVKQGQTAATGDQWSPFNDSTSLPLAGKWALAIIGSGAGTVAVNVVFGATETQAVSKER